MKLWILIATLTIHFALGEKSALVRHTAQNRIYYAYEAEKNQFPFMCFITNEDGGASIIAPKFLLTVAHVIFDAKERGDTLQVDCDLALNREKPGVTVMSKNLYTHPGYNGNFNLDYDMGIIELSKPLKFSASVQPIQLPPNNDDDYANQVAIVCGFGDTGKLRLIWYAAKLFRFCRLKNLCFCNVSWDSDNEYEIKNQF